MQMKSIASMFRTYLNDTTAGQNCNGKTCRTYFEANSASKGEGIGKTGKSLVEIPRCCLLMWECRELRLLATVPQSTHRYPGQTVCLSSICVLKVWADRYTFPHLGHGLGSVARTRIISNLPPTGKGNGKIHEKKPANQTTNTYG